MWAQRIIEYKSDQSQFVRPLTYPDSFWPNTSELAQIVNAAKSWFRSIGATDFYYYRNGNILTTYIVFDSEQSLLTKLGYQSILGPYLQDANLPISAEHQNLAPYINYHRACIEVSNVNSFQPTRVVPGGNNPLQITETDLVMFTRVQI